jgi:ABC-type dipeptide/oligopeptide/nickel transport system permease subunit
MRARLAPLGVGIVLLIALIAVAAPLIAPYDPITTNPLAVLEAPSLAHPMGTDNIGRDTLSRIIFGSRVSLQVGAIAVGIALVAGITIGLVAGYAGGWTDTVVMRAMDALQAFPALILALAITAALGPGLNNAMIAIGVVYVPLFARLIRAQVLAVRRLDYVEAARVLGASGSRIAVRHVLPNSVAPITVQATLSVGFAIIAEASLSFLGLGVQPPTATWGNMLKIGIPFMELSPWLAIFPGLAIFVTVLGFNLFGDGLRDSLDPRTHQ